jgi:hypothetical protein
LYTVLFLLGIVFAGKDASKKKYQTIPEFKAETKKIKLHAAKCH